jgi:hypothetical protein
VEGAFGTDVRIGFEVALPDDLAAPVALLPEPFRADLPLAFFPLLEMGSGAFSRLNQDIQGLR